jgi:membrane protein DedA with SNARE-associated domain/rhodanese-related sulfurtransferase
VNDLLQFVARHGSALLFAAVFVEQMGIPLPATPWLLAAGSLAAAGKINLISALAAATFASIFADAIWFWLGRHYGAQVLNLLCRISLERDSCVRRTQNVFTRYGMRGIFIAKFVPGLSTLAPPLAGSAGIKPSRFFFFDGLASLSYAAGFIFLGVLFSNQLEEILAALESLGGSAFGLLILLLALYVGYKFFQRQRLLRELRMARITVDELHQKLAAGEEPVILDVRALADIERDPLLIRGARHMTMDQVEAKHGEIPRDRDVIVYCSCPNEVSAAHVALSLRRKGILRVRPLLGGIDAWRERNYPVYSPPGETEGRLAVGYRQR